MAQFNENILIKIFIEIDDFCKCYEAWLEGHPERSYGKWKSCLSRSEAMTILVCYQLSGYKNFAYYYEKKVLPELSAYFPDMVEYKRFLLLIPSCLNQLYMYATWQAARASTMWTVKNCLYVTIGVSTAIRSFLG